MSEPFSITGTEVVKLVNHNDRALGRALVCLYNRQTQDEQAIRHTRHDNDRGFRPNHAPKGTEHAEFFLNNGYLTDEMVQFWRVRGKQGTRISIYWRQLVAEAYAKARRDGKQIKEF